MMAGMVAAAMAVVAATVFGLGDRRTMVSPPEAVVEDLLRALECRRYPQALKYFTRSAREKVSADQLAEATRRLESRIGRIEDVKGEEGWLSGDDAEATAVLRTDKADEVRVPLRLRRDLGEWRLTGIEGLSP
jgi:hypothetical protein